MPRKTLALIVGLILVTIILFIIALRTGQDTGSLTQEETMVKATPTPVEASIITLSPNPVAVVSGKQATVNVMLDSSYNKVTSVELVFKYDPLVVSNMKASLGPLFSKALILKDFNDPKTGLYTFAFGNPPSEKSVMGVGSVATITFTARGAIGKQSQILIEPSPATLVAAEGVEPSVLKSAIGATVIISSETTTDVMQPTGVQGAKAKKPTPTQAIVIPTTDPGKPNTTPQIPPPAN